MRIGIAGISHEALTFSPVAQTMEDFRVLRRGGPRVPGARRCGAGAGRRAIKLDPYRLVILVNGHGAPNHKRALQRLALEETDTRTRVVFESATGGIVPPDVDPGHAERGETAFVMAALPDSVDLGALPPIGTPLHYRDFGIVNGSAFDGRPTPDFAVPRGSDPRYATAEEGAEARARGIDRLALRVTEYLAEMPA